MKPTIKCHHVSVTKALKTYAEKKAEKLEKYFDHIQEIVVELNVNDASKESERQVAAVIIRASGTVLKAEQKSADMYASIDGVYEKMASQLKKYKEKLRAPKRDHSKKEVEAGIIPAKSSPKKKKISKSKIKSLYVTKPMTPEDAATILEDKKLTFLVFKNSTTHAVNVLYPEGDGFALIETE